MDFKGILTGSYSADWGPPYSGFPYRIGPWSESVRVKRGRIVRIRLNVEPTFQPVRPIYSYTAAAPGDPTPEQEVSGEVKVINRR
jgi:hypothetical protein